jgi:hypothetical protein
MLHGEKKASVYFSKTSVYFLKTTVYFSKNIGLLLKSSALVSSKWTSNENKAYRRKFDKFNNVIKLAQQSN